MLEFPRKKGVNLRKSAVFCENPRFGLSLSPYLRPLKRTLSNGKYLEIEGESVSVMRDVCQHSPQICLCDGETFFWRHDSVSVIGINCPQKEMSACSHAGHYGNHPNAKLNKREGAAETGTKPLKALRGHRVSKPRGSKGPRKTPDRKTPEALRGYFWGRLEITLVIQN